MIKPREINPQKITTFKKKLLFWGRDNFAEFSWRYDNEPFHSLVVEILLQRTRADQVVPVFEQFKKRFPSPECLAKSTVEKIEGTIYSLGLKWRAGNIAKLGKELCEKHDGIPPSDRDTLLELPGVGPYAAGAYLSLHTGIRGTIPDANMARILGRVFGFLVHAETRRDKDFLSLCEAVTPRRKFKEFNYAIIDFGREVCLPLKPRHSICPIRKICYYYRETIK